MPRPDLSAIPVWTGSAYPAPYAEMVEGRASLRPGAVLSLRHRNTRRDGGTHPEGGQR